MVKVLQYGEGNFLRSFVDLYFNTLNSEGFDFSVTIVKPANIGSIEKFARQNSKYSVVLRGYENGAIVENVYKVSCVDNAIDPFLNFADYIALAGEKDLKIIVSNTTEEQLMQLCFSKSR